jgi:prephenate dehydrogenase
MPLSDFTVGIIGLGQIGGSIAAALKCHHPKTPITGADLDETLCLKARERGLIDVVAVDAEDVIDQTDIVIIALPVLAISDLLRKYRDSLKDKFLVTDTGSLKEEILTTAATFELHNFVGGHPLAGTELSGEQAWNHDLFHGANYFTSAPDAVSTQSEELIDELIVALGAKRIIIDSRLHDRIFSVSSNLPHLFAYILKAQFERMNDLQGQNSAFACPSYRSATRVAHSDSEMVFQMLWGNRKNLAESLSDLRTDLERAQKALDSGDEMEFRRIFGNK